QPFFQGLEGAALFLLLLAVLSVGFWRSAANLAGHVRAGSQVIAEALGKQLRATADATAHDGEPASAAPLDVERLLPGLGAPLPVAIADGSPALGRSLGALNLRARTGATVLVIMRAGQGIVPSAAEALRAGDVLALAGSQEALAAARAILLGEGAPPPSG